MIRIAVELWPDGDSKQARPLGAVHIANTGDHPERPKRGNYEAQFFDRAGRRLGLAVPVRNWNRISKPVWSLIRKVLEKADY